MDFIYLADIHGDINKYEKLLEVAKEKNTSLIVLGGDLLPKHCNTVIEQPKFISDYLDDYFKRLKENNIMCLCILGNDDILSIDDMFNELCQRYENVFNIDGVSVKIGGYNFIGMSYVLDHPFACKDRVIIEDGYIFEPQLAPAFYSSINGRIEISNWEEYATCNLNKMRNQLAGLPTPDDKSKTIYVFHMPPSNLNLGVCTSGKQIGSQEIYDFLKGNNPYMSLHGHIHESPKVGGTWFVNLNETTCIQPGQTEKGDININYVLVDTVTKTFERFEESVFSNNQSYGENKPKTV